MVSEQTGKKQWIKPRVLERRSVSEAQVTKTYRLLEGTIVTDGLSIIVGPGS